MITLERKTVPGIKRRTGELIPLKNHLVRTERGLDGTMRSEDLSAFCDSGASRRAIRNAAKQLRVSTKELSRRLNAGEVITLPI